MVNKGINVLNFSALKIRFYRFRGMVAESGGPGCGVLCGRRGSLWRKLCWLVVVSFLAAQCVHECLLVFSEYAAFPVATSYSSDQGMAFPDVTICNANPLRRSRVCAYRTSLPGGKGVLKKVLDRDCSANITYSDVLQPDVRLSVRELLLLSLRHKRPEGRGVLPARDCRLSRGRFGAHSGRSGGRVPVHIDGDGLRGHGTRALARVVVYFNTVTYLKLTSVPKYDVSRMSLRGIFQDLNLWGNLIIIHLCTTTRLDIVSVALH
ncbi:hypothetical protein V5799_006215 [Amblyomma americanum]|uniref:Uncharacterized protein n=1 Tax=Amblyomma americanum TaxID=6943 RepID=A0AAQ4DX17_AMBAM